jgi:hypothetical protein
MHFRGLSCGVDSLIKLDQIFDQSWISFAFGAARRTRFEWEVRMAAFTAHLN